MKYSSNDGSLFWKNRIVILEKSTLIQQILVELHSSPIGGQSGITRTIARIASQFYWPHMRKNVKFFIKHCAVCQQAKTATTLPVGLLAPLPIPK